MGSEDRKTDASSDIFTTGFTAHTPSSDTLSSISQWDGYCCTVPWPDSTYMILEKGSNRAITYTNQTVFLQDFREGHISTKSWHCIHFNNYFAFYNPVSGRYIGHDGSSIICAKAIAANGYECITAKQHPNGGYQLLMPYYAHALNVMTIGEDGRSLVRREHGTTLWEFVKV
ncbi:hypothetical protein MGYG_07879 [Nannizzia gypsea CBS 118893]|uniref:Ricin B lectin domain-containing protein n=1 Tax=Arthroderma gypseum (strain ATCC MYA-4604 / CBS 118893) TaxID=535722 RepID=E4V4F4_ARTGP|nr:hypothetical protein MGYG_07879 [Nannizzia gypsea CBS 118893]EFR04878.1 hypothetical protein MGYG_07879 [Nannizzia gypsea CBS 118893]